MNTRRLVVVLAVVASGCTGSPGDGAPTASPLRAKGETDEAPSAAPSSSAIGVAPPSAEPVLAPARKPPTLSSAEPSTPPSTGPSTQPTGDAGPRSKEELEWLNDGCYYRKSTNKISRCVAESNSVGPWKPTKEEIAPALKLGAGVCYCARPLEIAALTCMDSAKSPVVRVVIGEPADPTDCGVSVSTAEFEERRFVRMLADNRDRSTFYQVEEIVEITAGGAVAYYEGFEPLTEAMVKAAEAGVSNQLRADWALLSPAAKRWLTTRP